MSEIRRKIIKNGTIPLMSEEGMSELICVLWICENWDYKTSQREYI